MQHGLMGALLEATDPTLTFVKASIALIFSPLWHGRMASREAQLLTPLPVWVWHLETLGNITSKMWDAASDLNPCAQLQLNTFGSFIGDPRYCS